MGKKQLNTSETQVATGGGVGVGMHLEQTITFDDNALPSAATSARQAYDSALLVI